MSANRLPLITVRYWAKGCQHEKAFTVIKGTLPNPTHTHTHRLPSQEHAESLKRVVLQELTSTVSHGRTTVAHASGTKWLAV